MKQQDEFKIVELLIINKASIEISTYQRFTFVFSVSWNWPFENGAHEYVKTHARAHTYIYIFRTSPRKRKAFERAVTMGELWRPESCRSSGNTEWKTPQPPILRRHSTKYNPLTPPVSYKCRCQTFSSILEKTTLGDFEFSADFFESFRDEFFNLKVAKNCELYIHTVYYYAPYNIRLQNEMQADF